MTDIQAAVGREQLKRLPEIIERRRYLAQRYQEMLADVPGLKLPTEPTSAKNNWQSFCVRLPETSHQVQMILDVGVFTRRGIMCTHRESAYQNEAWSCGIKQNSCECQSGGCQRLSESEQAQKQVLFYHCFIR
jgi:perosamine synthetase